MERAASHREIGGLQRANARRLRMSMTDAPPRSTLSTRLRAISRSKKPSMILRSGDACRRPASPTVLRIAPIICASSMASNSRATSLTGLWRSASSDSVPIGVAPSEADTSPGVAENAAPTAPVVT